MTLDAQTALAALEWRLDRHREAEKRYRAVWEMRRKYFGVWNPMTIHSSEWLVDLVADQDRWREAEQLHLERIQRLDATLGPDHAVTRTAIARLEAFYFRTGEKPRMLPFLEQYVTKLRRTTAAGGGRHNRAMYDQVLRLARNYQAAQRPGDAMRLIEEELNANERSDARSFLQLRLAEAYLDSGRSADALASVRKALTERDSAAGWLANMSLFFRQGSATRLLIQLRAWPEAEAEMDTLLKSADRVPFPAHFCFEQLLSCANEAHSAGNSVAAANLWAHVQSWILSTAGPCTTKCVTLADNLAADYAQAGRPDDARTFLVAFHRKDAYAADARFQSENDDQAARTFADIALSLMRREFLWQRARLLQKHGLVQEALNDFAAAVREQQQLRARGGDQAIHQRYLVPLIWQYGVALLRAGQTEAAEERLDEAIALREMLAQAPTHAPCDVRLLAAVYLDRGREDLGRKHTEQARQWLTKAVDTARKVPSAAWIRASVARIHADQQQFDEAIALLEQLRKDCRQSSEYWVRDHLSTLLWLANYYEALGRLPAAADVAREAWELRQQHFGPDHRFLRLVQYAPGAYLHWQLQDFNEADQPAQRLALVQQMVTEIRQMPGLDRRELAMFLARLGVILLERQACADAEPLLRECLEIREQFEPDAWTTANARSLLGDALAGQGRLAEAEPLLLDGYLGLRARQPAIPAAGRIWLRRSLERLVILYQRLARPDEAARWQALLE